MENKQKVYKQLEFYMTCALIADAVLFVLYLIAAGAGIIWLKVILAILAFGLSGLCLYVLFVTKELLRQRSFWMTVASASIIICTLFSLVLRFP